MEIFRNSLRWSREQGNTSSSKQTVTFSNRHNDNTQNDTLDQAEKATDTQNNKAIAIDITNDTPINSPTRIVDEHN